MSRPVVSTPRRRLRGAVGRLGFSRSRCWDMFRSNLNFFEQPLPGPEVEQAENGVDVDITISRITVNHYV